MEIIFVLLPLSICLAVFALGGYLWSVHNGQLDDLETPAMRAIFDDQELKKPAELVNLSEERGSAREVEVGARQLK